jgi:hypothetical protein
MKRDFEVGFTMIDNALLRYWMPTLSEAQLKVYLFVASKTDGWNKPTDFISTSQLVEGTGMSSSAARQAGADLMDYGLIVRVPGQLAKKAEHAKHAQYSLLDPWRASVIAEGGDPDKVLDSPSTEKQLRALDKPASPKAYAVQQAGSVPSSRQEPASPQAQQNTSHQYTSNTTNSSVAKPTAQVGRIELEPTLTVLEGEIGSLRIIPTSTGLTKVLFTVAGRQCKVLGSHADRLLAKYKDGDYTHVEGYVENGPYGAEFVASSGYRLETEQTAQQLNNETGFAAPETIPTKPLTSSNTESALAEFERLGREYREKQIRLPSPEPETMEVGA